MPRPHSRFSAMAAVPLLASLLLAACSSTPPLPAKASLQPSREQFRIQLDRDFLLDYQIERTISKLNGRSCFAFITGTLRNQSQQTLSRRSILDFIVISQTQQLFRDLSNPVSHIAPGGSAAFVMVVSPVHGDGCPPYDKINVSLRKVFLQ